MSRVHRHPPAIFRVIFTSFERILPPPFLRGLIPHECSYLVRLQSLLWHCLRPSPQKWTWGLMSWMILASLVLMTNKCQEDQVTAMEHLQDSYSSTSNVLVLISTLTSTRNFIVILFLGTRSKTTLRSNFSVANTGGPKTNFNMQEFLIICMMTCKLFMCAVYNETAFVRGCDGKER